MKGVEISSFSDFSEISLDSNYFFLAGFNLVGIDIEEVLPKNNKLYIKSNYFQFNKFNIGSQSGLRSLGIRAISNRNVSILDNDFHVLAGRSASGDLCVQDDDVEPYENCAINDIGIHLIGLANPFFFSNNEISGNTFTLDESQITNGFSPCILVSDFHFAKVCDNYNNFSRKMFEFRGELYGIDFRLNTSVSGRLLDITQGSFIGEQDQQGNQYIITDPYIFPNASASPDIAFLSPFNVHQPQAQSNEPSNPFHPTYIVPNDATFWKLESGSPKNDCIEPESPISISSDEFLENNFELFSRIANGQLEEYLNSEEEVFISKNKFFNYLKEYHDISKLLDIFQIFYNEQREDDIGKLSRIQDLINSYYIDDLEANLYDAMHINNSILGTLLPVKKQKYVNSILIYKLQNPLAELSDEQENIIMSIANMCSRFGGNAVNAARRLVPECQQDSFWDVDEQCFTSSDVGIVKFIDTSIDDFLFDTENLEVSNKSVGLTIFPNPTSQTVEIRTGINGVINVYNMYGDKIKSLDCEGSLQLDVSNLVNGLYPIQLIQGDGTVVSETIIKID